MSKFILIHGAWHGAWCWDKVVPILKEEGYEVLAPDLPGHGNNKTPITDVNLDSYIKLICDLLDQELEPVFLVGHSMGGISITQVAELRSDKIKTLVYLAAHLPRNGESLNILAENDEGSLVTPNVILSDDLTYTTIKKESVGEVFYGDCSDADVAWAQELMGSEATTIPPAKVVISPDNYGSVKKVYIECLLDQAIPIAMQKRMYQNSPCDQVYTMNASHSPFLSNPRELADLLIEIGSN